MISFFLNSSCLFSSPLGRKLLLIAVITWHMQDNQWIRHSQHRFRKAGSCMTNLISFFDRVVCSVGKGMAVDVVYWEVNKASNTVSHNILLEELTARGLGGHGLSRVKRTWAVWPGPEWW